ncbi:MAG: hypothetical protein WBN75_14305 [Verrucomicrobiia bacterium]
MAYLNDNYLKLKAGYLFPEIGRRVKAFCDTSPSIVRSIASRNRVAAAGLCSKIRWKQPNASSSAS